MTERPCQAPEHVEGCDGRGRTRDHFQPKCILRLWRARNKRSNIQYLSPACHIEKDRDTALRAQVLDFQMNGGSLTFDEHRAVFERGHL